MTGCRRILPARSFEESFNSQRRGIPLLEKREKWGTPSVAYADEVKRLNSQRPWNPTPSQSTRRDGPPLVLLMRRRSRAYAIQYI